MSSKSSAVKRLMKELAELKSSPCPEFTAAPLEDDLFEWHFTLRGPPEGGFEGGRYHGRIIFPYNYPFAPPNIILLTPNGRFVVGKKICLSITGYHPEFWRPAWGIRTALVAIISFFLTKGEGAIGALDMPQEGRRQLALKSKTWTCPVCHSDNATSLPNEETAPSIRLESEPEITLTQVAASRADSSSSADKQLAKPSLETESAILENVSEESKSKAAVLLSSSSDSTTQREFIQESAQTQLIQEGTQVIQESIQTHIIQDELQHEASEASTMERLHRRRQEMIYKIDVAILSILALIIALIYRLIS